MNILQILGAVLYTVSLATIMARTILEKQEEPAALLPCLLSGIILCSANERLNQLNLGIVASLSIFAALLIGIPSVYLNKKGGR